MTPRGGRREGAGRPRVGDEIKIALREEHYARAAERGDDVAARVRLALDVLAALEEGRSLAVLRVIAMAGRNESTKGA